MGGIFKDYDWPLANPDHKPFSHQIETTEFLVKNKRSFVLNDLGTGKTMSALWAADFLMKLGLVKKVLVVSPLTTVQSVWGNEIKTNLKHRSYVIAHGPKKQEAIASKADFVIINHDGVKFCESELVAAGFKLIIIDELTAFKNNKAERWKSMYKIASKAVAVWGMTAEPTPNSPVEAFGQAKLINPTNPFLPQYITKFRDMVEQKITAFMAIPKAEAPAVVFKVLQPSIRFERDKCVDIPPCQYIDLEIEMTKNQKKAYDDMFKQMLLEYESGEITASNAAVKLVKLLQISTGWVKSDDGGVFELDSSIRLDELLEIFANTHKNKLVVYSPFRASVEGVHKFFKSKNIKCEFIHGDVKQELRAKYIDQFQNGDLQILVMQPQTVAHGITLTAASTIVWHGMIPSGEIYNQANGRITRIGQKEKQTIIHLIGSKAEKHIRNILRSKGNVSKEILDLFRN